MSELRCSIAGHWCLDRVGIRETAIAGQRLRASLVWIGAGSPVDINGGMVAAATAVELLHLATLVHDDIIDGSPFRRGQPATWALHGTGSAIVAGDALLAASFGLMAEMSSSVVRELATSLATVCDGQMMEFDDVGATDRGTRRIESVAALKTGALFGGAMAIGTALSPDAVIEPAVARRLGQLFGVAYQLVDDLHDLDLEGSGMGQAGSDLAAGLVTQPWAIAFSRQLLDEARAELADSCAVTSTDPLAKELWSSGCVDAAHSRARELLDGVSSEAAETLSPSAAAAFAKLCDAVRASVDDLIRRNGTSRA
jgi:geranylgeranyl pyrophosphate synthase